MRRDDPDHREEKKSLHEMYEVDAEKVKPDGTPVTLVDLIIDKRYAEREHDSDYYDEKYYYSEYDSEESSGEDSEE